MTLLDELSIRNQEIDGEVWVSLKDVATHFVNSLDKFSHESSAVAVVHPFTKIQAAYINGIYEGMSGIISLLAQGGAEAEFHNNVHTVDDLLKRLEQDNDS